jgi:hypothetical protein
VRCVDTLPPSTAEDKERVEMYLYSPFMLSWLVTGRAVSFNFAVDVRLSCIFDNHNRFTISNCAGSANVDWNSVIRSSTRSPFVTYMSRRAQSGRRISFGRRLWFTESLIVLVIFFLLIGLFIHLFLI